MNDDISTIDRRSGEPERPDAPGGFRFAGMEFDSRRQELRRDGVPIALRPKPLALLRYLLAHPGRLLAKQELIGALWGGTVVTDDSLVQCVGELRSALGDREQRLIRTLPRRGYLFDAQIEPSMPGRLEPGPALPADPVTGRPPRHAPATNLRWTHWLVAGVALLSISVLGAAWLWRAKGIAEPMEIDREIAARRAVAVLPLADPGAPAATSDLSIGIADAVVTHASLRSRPATAIIGRASTTSFDPVTPDIARIGRELNVRYVVSGRVVRQAGEVHLITQMTAVDGGQVLTLDQSRFPDDATALRSNTGQRVAAAMRMRYLDFETTRFRDAGRTPDATDLAMAGWRDINRFITREDLVRGRQRLEAAARADPRSVIVAQGIGVSLLVEFSSLMSSEPAATLERSVQALRHALELGPTVQENQAAWADALSFSGDAVAAEAVLRGVLDANPNYSTAHVGMAHALTRQGRFEEAALHIDKLRNLSALDTRLMRQYYGSATTTALARGDEAQSRELLSRWIADYPNAGIPHLFVAALDARAGRDAGAAAAMARHRQLLPASNIDYVKMAHRSDNPRYRESMDRLIDGMRKAGLPEH